MVNIYKVLSLGPDGKPLCPLRHSDNIITHIRHIVAKSNSSDLNALHRQLLDCGRLRRRLWNKLLRENDKTSGTPCCLADQQQQSPSSSTSDFDQTIPVSSRHKGQGIATLPISPAPSTDLTAIDDLSSSKGLKVETAKALADGLASICYQSSSEYVAPGLLLQVAPTLVAAFRELATTSLSLQLRDTLKTIHLSHDPTIQMEAPSSLSDIIERDAGSGCEEISQQAQANPSMAIITRPLAGMNTGIDPELEKWWNEPRLVVDELPAGENIAHRLYLAVSIHRHRSKSDNRVTRAKHRLYAIQFFRLRERFVQSYCGRGRKDPLVEFLHSLGIEVESSTRQYATRGGKRYDILSQSHPGFLFLEFHWTEKEIRDQMSLATVSETIEPSFQDPLMEWYDQLGVRVHTAMEAAWVPWITGLTAEVHAVHKARNSGRLRISEVIELYQGTSASSTAPTSEYQGVSEDTTH